MQAQKQPVPYRRSIGDSGQADCHLATLLHIVMVHSWFYLQQVWSCSDGHLLLEPAGTVSTTHQHKGIFCIWLQLSDQFSLQVPWNLNTLLVVQDLEPSSMLHLVIRRFTRVPLMLAF